MESPKREPRTPACEHQGSPLFKFLCSLSPIKQAKSVQAYSELSFPAASSQVFSSPSEKKPGKKQAAAAPPPPAAAPPPQAPPKSEGGGVPGGIGLHLNSLASLLPRGISLQSFGEIQSDSKSTVTVTSGAATSTTNFRSNLLLSVIERTRTDEQEFGSDASQKGVIKSTTCVRALTLGIQAVENPGVSFDVDNLATPRKRRLSLGDNELARTPPKKKRRSSLDKDGCKRCHCKKSKCLKLYCECFAAGVYCLDSCACRDCFNKPEFSETVLGTRQQIETRNPLAFAPKVIQTTDCLPGEGLVSPDAATAAARHKRGCNCKKSQCLKKYCECYQVGVGCSDGCRCNGCKNIYGAKKVEPEDMDQLDEGCGDFVTSTSSFSPVTPFQCKPPLMASGFSKPFYQSGPCGFSVQGTRLFPSPPEQPSPRWQGLDELYSVTPLAQHPMRPPATASLDKADDIIPSKPAYPEQFLACEDSPETPVSDTPLPKTTIDYDQLPSDESPDTDHRSMLVAGTQETPEFLRDDRRLVIKGGSPKQKRVLPPNILSGGGILRSGRKLTLQTLPCLPPVTSFKQQVQVLKRSR